MSKLRDEMAFAILAKWQREGAASEVTAADAALTLLLKSPVFDDMVSRADAYGQRGLFTRGIKKRYRVEMVAEMLRAALGGDDA